MSGILSALAALSFFIESLFPPMIVPGARLGLSNVFVLLSVILTGNGYGYAVMIIKIIIGSAFSGGLSSIMYSLPSGLIALTLQIVLIGFKKRFGIVAVSVCGSLVNLLTQNAIFCLITSSHSFMVYSPYLALISIISGAAVGYIVYLIAKLLPAKFFTVRKTEGSEN